MQTSFNGVKTAKAKHVPPPTKGATTLYGESTLNTERKTFNCGMKRTEAKQDFLIVTFNHYCCGRYVYMIYHGVHVQVKK